MARTKKQLLAEARGRGLDVNDRMTVAQLEAALAGPSSPPAGGDEDAVVASDEANSQLEHTDDRRDQAEVGPARVGVAGVEEGHSVTTRDDRTDLGAPMLAGSPDEPVGPEDALGRGPTRGDYRARLGGADYHPHEGGEPQRPRAEEIGDVEGRKGGVDTA